MVKKKSNKSRKKISLTEFKAWLSGVEEMQPEGWAPNAEQWQLIRNKIDNIVETVAPSTNNSQMLDQTAPPASHAPLQRQEASCPPFNSGPPSELPVVAPETAVPATSTPPPLTPSADGKIKTPNIDTTDGSYDSIFS